MRCVGVSDGTSRLERDADGRGALASQPRRPHVSLPRRHLAFYWLVILLASIAGTRVSDHLSRTLRLGCALDTLLLAVIFGLAFACSEARALPSRFRQATTPRAS